MASHRSFPALDLRTYPHAPDWSASCTTSAELSCVRKMTFAAGANSRICRAASIPLSLGRPISINIKSGASCLAFATPSNPSDTSQITCMSGFSLRKEVTKARYGSKSSTTRMRVIVGERFDASVMVSSPKLRIPPLVEEVRSTRSWITHCLLRCASQLDLTDVKRLQSAPYHRIYETFSIP